MKPAMLSRTLLSTMRVLGCTIGTWTVVHFASVHAYGRVCVPLTASGLVLSPLMVNTPHCSALRWVLQRGAFGICETWDLLALTMASAVATSVLRWAPRPPDARRRHGLPDEMVR